MTTKAMSTSAHSALPAHLSSPTLQQRQQHQQHQLQQQQLANSKRGHIRSASLENANSFISKNTLGLPVVQQANHTGTLKSRNEQKRMRNKFGSHSNLEDYVQQGRTKFQNIRQMFEITKKASAGGSSVAAAAITAAPPSITDASDSDVAGQMLHSLPATITASVTANNIAANYVQAQQPVRNSNSSNIQTAFTQQQLHTAYQQQYAAQQQQQQHHHQHQHQHQHQQLQQLPRKPTPPTTTATVAMNGCGNRNSISQDLSDRLNIIECLDAAAKQKVLRQQQMQQQQQQQQQQAQPQIQRRSASGLSQLQQDCSSISSSSENANQATTLLRPIAFKPIPFEPDYSIPSRYCDVAAVVVGDRYGSTPSLAPVQGSNLRFGSTTDLRHGGGCGSIIGNTGNSSIGSGVGVASIGGVGVGGVVGGIVVGGYSSNIYCNSLMARRRGSRSLKINDSMESIRHTPDSDANSQTSTIKSNCSNGNATLSANGGSGNSGNSKYLLSSGGEQCDMTPSPSDSGISDLEAALKDRDSELSYLRQTMEHNEKVIFKVQKDKEAFWENETKRLKIFYEGQQREYILKMKKMEQMLQMQQFQLKQHKLRHTEQSNKLREQVSDLKNDNEILRSNNSSLKNSERNLKDSVAYIEEQLRESQVMIAGLKSQLEESEWKVCERNGEIALLKTQLKEANVELTMKEHAIVHLKHENTNAETQIYQSLQENHKIAQQQKQVDEQKAKNQKETETEMKQLNKIVILKDQVILALTNELAKLRKELSDLAIFHEYGEEPSGKFMRLKQQLDNLTDICNKTRKHAASHVHKLAGGSNSTDESKEKVIDDINLEVIMNCLKIAPALNDDSDYDDDVRGGGDSTSMLSAEKRLAKMSADIQNFVYGSQNLPDVAVNVKPLKCTHSKLEESTLDTLIEESASYAEEISKLRKQLDDVRVNFELEKRQWFDEKEKVLSYQKQLQAHYINMYQKLRSLESTNEV